MTIVSDIGRYHTDDSNLQNPAPPTFLNGIERPQQKHSSLHKLQLTSPRNTIQAFNIGLKRQQQPNT